MAKLSWKPVLLGGIYCSPACGGSCLHSSYFRATRGADALVRLLGPAWKPRVWENLGWHYAATLKGKASVHPPHIPGAMYSADINAGRQFIAYDMDPRRAFSAAVKMCDKYIEACTKARDEMIKANG